MFRKVMAGSTSRLTIVDHEETYGRHVLSKIASRLSYSSCVDLGCGNGDDLLILREHNPNAKLFGIDFKNREVLAGKGIQAEVVDIEKEMLPFESESIDIIVANQVLEHTKEVYWINHEIFRVLSVGGFFFLGVPNVLSLHNRILGLFGTHPTTQKMISAHVRCFSKRDTLLFYEEIAGKFVSLKGFYGSQFYPFPKVWARFLSNCLPSLSFSIFFLFEKTSKYSGEFIDWPSVANLETNFYCGSELEKKLKT